MNLFRTIVAVATFLLASLPLSAFAAVGPITIDKVTESFDPKTNTYTYTVVIKNTGKLVVDYYVTAQPYNDKQRDANNKPKDAATRQIQKVNLGGGQKTTVKFEFTGADGKDWKFKYTDVFDGDPAKKGTTMIVGDIGEFTAHQVPPGSGLNEQFAFQFPYPYAALVEELGTANFQIEITNQLLPPGWEVNFINPIPGDLFTLTPSEVQPIDIFIRSNGPIFEGQSALVDFDFVNPESGLRWNSEIGVEVSEAASLLLLGVGLLLLLFMKAVATC